MANYRIKHTDGLTWQQRAFKKYYEKNKERLREEARLRHKIKREKDPEGCKEQHRKYINANKDKKKQWDKNYLEKISNDPIRWREFLDKVNIRYAVRKSKRSFEENMKRSKRQLYQRYGMTIEDFENLKASQNNLCAICHIKLEEDIKAHIDHNHETGKVRGILCMPCNTGLGLFKDNIEILQNAVEYLKREQSGNSRTINNLQSHAAHGR